MIFSILFCLPYLIESLGYMMKGTGFNLRKGSRFLSSSPKILQTDTGPTQPAIQREQEFLILGIKLPECEADCTQRYFAQ
jgi:hypothetical protein